MFKKYQRLLVQLIAKILLSLWIKLSQGLYGSSVKVSGYQIYLQTVITRCFKCIDDIMSVFDNNLHIYVNFTVIKFA